MLLGSVLYFLSGGNGTLWAQVPRLVYPTGHTSIVSTLAYSPDGRMLASGSWDNTIKIWEGNEGFLLQDLRAHEGSILSLQWTPDSRYLISTSKDFTARIWEPGSGKLLGTITGFSDWVTGIALAPDGRSAALGGAGGELGIFSIPEGKPLFKNKSRHDPWVSSLAAAKGYFFSGGWDSTVKVWDAATGKELLQSPRVAGRIQQILVLQNGKKLLILTDNNRLYHWDLPCANCITEIQTPAKPVYLAGTGNYTVLHENGLIQLRDGLNETVKGSVQLPADNWQVLTASTSGKWIAAASDSGKAVLLDATRLILQEQWQAHQAPIRALSIQPATGTLATGSWDNTIRFWESGQEKAVAQGSSHGQWPNKVVFDSSGQFLLSASNDGTARRWNRNGSLLTTYSGHTDWVQVANFSPDGRKLVTASHDYTARIWDSREGNTIYTLRGHDDWVNTAEFSADGKWVITASSDGTARVWRVSNGQEQFVFSGHGDWVTEAHFSSDGKYALTASIDNKVRIWELQGGTLYKILGQEGDSLRTAVFSPDAQWVLTASKDRTLALWSMEDGKRKWSQQLHLDWINKILFNQNGTLFAALSQDHTASVYSMADQRFLFLLQGHTRGIADAAFSDDGKYLATAGWDQEARVWDLSTGKAIAVLQGHEASLNAIAFRPGTHEIFTAAEDNTLRSWNGDSGKERFRFFALDSADFLVMDPQGRFDGSPAARSSLYFTCGTERIDLEQFKSLSWEPDLGAKLNGTNKEPITALPLQEQEVCGYFPEVKALGKQQGNYVFSVLPRRGGIGPAELFVNGKRVASYPVTAYRKTVSGYRLWVPEKSIVPYLLSGSSNQLRLQVQAKGNGLLSRGGVITVRNTKNRPNPDLYIITVGISTYKAEKLALKFASKDARELGHALEGAGRKLLNTDHKEHVYSYVLNSDSTNSNWPVKKNILRVLDTVAKKAKPEDVVLLFFAGHGLLYNTGKTFYLLTADAAGFDLEGVSNKTAISADELNAWMCRVKANKQLLILDACNSGKVIQDVKELIAGRGLPADHQRALERLKDKTGTFILSAAAADQSAYETSLYRQGLLTYSLLTGLKLGQGLKDQQYIDVNRWFNFAADNVKLLAKDIGGRQDPQLIGNGTFDIGLVDQEVSDGIQLSIRRKVFRQSRFIQDENLLNDDLDLSERCDRQLDNVSLQGKEIPVVYIPGNKFADAYSLRGRYSISGDTVRVRSWVVNGKGERIREWTWEAAATESDTLVEQMVQAVVQYFNKPD